MKAVMSLAVAVVLLAGAGAALKHTAPNASASVPVSMPPRVAPLIDAGAAIPQEEPQGPDYNGRFTYVRLRFGDGGTDLRQMDFRGFGRRGRGAPWSHDWPRAEVNFAKILEAATFIDVYSDGNAGRVLTIDDPDLFLYPVATIIEVGYWAPSEEEVEILRSYLLKGGFLIIDDTRGNRAIQNFAYQMRRVLPELDIKYVPEDHEIFNSFFAIDDPYALVPPYGYEPPAYLGMFEGNDVLGGRLMVMINYNQDLQEYWEYSDRGYYPIDLSNEAYKFGVNYLVYAFTH